MDDITVTFDFPTDTSTGSPKIIKVIGVGGGGCNAVNHMFKEGIQDVTFTVCNTDSKALNDSPVLAKLQLGEGLGAGNDPEVGRIEAENSTEEIKEHLSDGTKMVFITAGMGGGTGTGAAPVIAKIAKEMGILTVAIVTIPHQWEGNPKIDQALDGVEAISKQVDALIVIKNDKLLEIYGGKESNLGWEESYDKADDIALVATKSIADIITMHGRINLDFNDVRKVLENGGVAIMGTGYGTGDERISKAIREAQTSPLLNDNDIFSAKKVLLCISYSSESELMINEMHEVKEFMSHFNHDIIETKHGIEKDESLGNQVKVTLLATGFGIQDIHHEKLDERIATHSKEEQEKKEKEDERKRLRRSRYYTENKSKTVRRHFYLFNSEDLDNADIIGMVEDIPTYRRSKTELTNIEEKSMHDKTTAKEEVAQGEDGIITF